jgi:hypothetical protein
LGRKKLINKTKVTHANKLNKEEKSPEIKEILNRNLILINISELKEMPSTWAQGYSLQENDTIEQCCKLYEDRYKHDPLEGWLYTNKQGQKLLYLKLEKNDK